jgi:hypothetical protein
MDRTTRVKIPFQAATRLILTYGSRKIQEQIKAIGFIVVYLFLFLHFIFQIPLSNLLEPILFISLVVLGLTLFLEGIFLGLMPLGEKVGIQLPIKTGLLFILVFSLLLGVGSTLAEPAIQVLRMVGANVTPEATPLLFLVLEQYNLELMLSIALGVGIAVVIGITRFYFGLGLKPFIFTIIPLSLIMSVVALIHPTVSDLIGIAWDAGAVTTGVVTVPLVLALGIGVSKHSRSKKNMQSQFGVIMMASALPVITVLGLGFILAPQIDGNLVASPIELHLGNSESQPPMSTLAPNQDVSLEQHSFLEFLGGEYQVAFLSVFPLTLFLALVLFLILRDRPKYRDEVILGVVLAFLGMGMLTGGIALGLTPLGNAAGQRLPRLLEQPAPMSAQVITLSPDQIIQVVDPGVGSRPVIPVMVDGQIQFIPFEENRFDPSTSTYRLPQAFILEDYRLRTLVQFLLFFMFPFGLGYGSTLAEPALKALGNTVEKMTVGTLKSQHLIQAVSLGVGTGLVLGVIRIIMGIPLATILLISYTLAMILTLFVDEEFCGIAWDSGGVTTGPLTVPLVLALGLGLGNQLNISDGFGILSLASSMPIISVLLLGIKTKFDQARQVRETEDNHEA